MTKFFGWVFSLHYVGILAVVAPVFGSALMFMLGTLDTVRAYLIFFGKEEPEGAVEAGEAAMIKLVASVDHFLFGTILLVFAIGLYFLLFRSGRSDGSDKHHRIPSWQHLKKLEGMDLMLLKVIIMLLTVSFLEFTLTAGIAALTWPSLVIPITIIALAIALKWMQEGPEDSDSSPQQPESAVASHSGTVAYLGDLERLAALRERQAITDDEYDRKKQELLNQ